MDSGVVERSQVQLLFGLVAALVCEHSIGHDSLGLAACWQVVDGVATWLLRFGTLDYLDEVLLCLSLG